MFHELAADAAALFAASPEEPQRPARRLSGPLHSVHTSTPLRDAARSALGGGLAGGAAMVANVGLLMWLR